METSKADLDEALEALKIEIIKEITPAMTAILDQIVIIQGVVYKVANEIVCNFLRSIQYEETIKAFRSLLTVDASHKKGISKKGYSRIMLEISNGKNIPRNRPALEKPSLYPDCHRVSAPKDRIPKRHVHRIHRRR